MYWRMENCILLHIILSIYHLIMSIPKITKLNNVKSFFLVFIYEVQYKYNWKSIEARFSSLSPHGPQCLIKDYI